MVLNDEKVIQLIEVRKVLTEYKMRFDELIKKKIQDEDMIATGQLLASIHTEVEEDGYIYKVVLNSREYIKYLESGTKPHWPPTEPILKWVRDKKLPTAEYTGDKKLPTEKQLAYLVRRKISIEGTEAKPIIATTVEQLNEQYLPRLVEALKLDVYNAIPTINIQLRFK